MMKMRSPQVPPGAPQPLGPAQGFQCSPKAKGKGEGSLASRGKFLADSIPTASWKVGQILLPLWCPSAGIPALGTPGKGTSVPLRQDSVGGAHSGLGVRAAAEIKT